MGVVLALIRAQPDRYLHIMGVEWLLDCMYTCYADDLNLSTSCYEDDEGGSVKVRTIEDQNS